MIALIAVLRRAMNISSPAAASAAWITERVKGSARPLTRFAALSTLSRLRERDGVRVRVRARSLEPPILALDLAGAHIAVAQIRLQRCLVAFLGIAVAAA